MTEATLAPAPPAADGSAAAPPEGESAVVGLLGERTRLRAAVFAAPGGTGRGTVVLAGGPDETIEDHLAAVARFRERGLAVVAFDWRGTGGSDREAGAGCHVASFEDYARDLAAAVRLAGERDLPRPLVVVAQSAGAIAAVLAAPRLQRDVERMVLLAPLAEPRRAAGFVAHLSAALARILGRSRREAPEALDPFAADPPAGEAAARRDAVRAARPDLAVGRPTHGFLRALRTASARVLAGRATTGEIPVLVLAAGADRVSSPAAADRLARQLTGAPAVALPRAPHRVLSGPPAALDLFLAAFDAFAPPAQPRLPRTPPRRRGERATPFTPLPAGLALPFPPPTVAAALAEAATPPADRTLPADADTAVEARPDHPGEPAAPEESRATPATGDVGRSPDALPAVASSAPGAPAAPGRADRATGAAPERDGAAGVRAPWSSPGAAAASTATEDGGGAEQRTHDADGEATGGSPPVRRSAAGGDGERAPSIAPEPAAASTAAADDGGAGRPARGADRDAPGAPEPDRPTTGAAPATTAGDGAASAPPPAAAGSHAPAAQSADPAAREGRVTADGAHGDPGPGAAAEAADDPVRTAAAPAPGASGVSGEGPRGEGEPFAPYPSPEADAGGPAEADKDEDAGENEDEDILARIDRLAGSMASGSDGADAGAEGAPPPSEARRRRRLRRLRRRDDRKT